MYKGDGNVSHMQSVDGMSRRSKTEKLIYVTTSAATEPQIKGLFMPIRVRRGNSKTNSSMD